MKLAILKSPQSGNDVTISCLPFVIGRCRSADFIIAHVNVSRNHCEIVKENMSWKVKDYSSSGTYVNESLVGKGKSEILTDGDSIRFGPVESNLTWTFYSYDYSSENFNDSDVKPGLRMVLGMQNKKCVTVNEHCCGEEMNEIKEDIFDKKFSRKKNETKGEENDRDKKLNHCKTTSEGLNVDMNHTYSSGKGYCIDKCEGEKTEELSKELNHSLQIQQFQNDLIDLKEKNSALQEELFAGTTCKTEPVVASNLLENLTDLMEAEFQCTICSELFVIAITLSCTHTFCKHCINQWKKKQKTCPICRKKITNETRSLVVDNYIDKMVGNLSLELKKRREAIIEERNKIEPCKKKSRLKNKYL